ncbi:MAG: DNA polymerase III subunit delta', partial [Chloroflexota bacterium]|nr:DNA polymerase III subunit delta' [Chloroflexota bacterium]
MWNIVGQEGAVELLRQGLAKGNLSHAYLFVGPPNVGKMTLAVKLAQALNCEGTERPCENCRPCQRIASGKHADVQVIAPLRDDQGRPKREIGIDQVRELLHSASLKPYEGRHRVFIVEGAERLTQEAANCFLKTLEEPPSQVLILLLAHREGDLLPTLLSRCQKVALQPLPMSVVEKALIEAGRETGQAKVLAHLSQGRIGWALSASAETMAQRQATLERLFGLLGAGREERFVYAADLAAHLARDKDEAQEELEQWLTWWRDLLL